MSPNNPDDVSYSDSSTADGESLDLPTCEDCGLTYLHTTSGGPGQTRRSCGCSTTPDLVTDGGVQTTGELLPQWTAEAGDCSECGSEETVVEHEDGTRICVACDAHLRGPAATDGGVPDSLEDLAATCESCGSDVEPRYLEDGECPGCVYGEPMTDGGVHTVEHNGTTFAVCHMVAYDDHADLDIDYSGEEPVVTNHDDVPKHDEVRLLTLDSVREHGMEHMAIGPSHSMWREEFADLEPGDSIDLDEEEPVADGGTAWTDLTGFKRDCLEAIRRLDEDGETTYGLAVKRELERVYGEDVNHGRLYPNLDDLVDYGLVEKRELDKRTNEYELTDAAQAMLEQRARLLADACGMQQPVADGGEN